MTFKTSYGKRKHVVMMKYTKWYKQIIESTIIIIDMNFPVFFQLSLWSCITSAHACGCSLKCKDSSYTIK